MKQYQLNYDEHKLQSKMSITRVKVSAISFDWVFDGDNCQNLILYLVNHGDSSLFKTKSIKTFILLLWDKFQPVIVK